MKKILFVLCLLTVINIPVLAQGGLRYTIQVREFENRSGWSGQWRLGDAWGAVLTDKLQQSGRFMVIAEQGMRNEAQLIIKGVITAFDDGTKGGGKKTSSITGTVYVVDTRTGMVMASHPFEAKVKSNTLRVGVYKGGFSGNLGGFKKTGVGKVMDKACDQVQDFLFSQLESVPWSGTVIKGGEDKIIINRGSREGVTVGLQLKTGKAEEIRDPDTGELLDTDFTETGRIEVTKVMEKFCYAKKVSGKAPRKGDQVYN